MLKGYHGTFRHDYTKINCQKIQSLGEGLGELACWPTRQGKAGWLGNTEAQMGRGRTMRSWEQTAWRSRTTKCGLNKVYLIKNTVLFCTRPQEAVAGGCETEVDVTFLALGFWCTVASWYLPSPFLCGHDHPVGGVNQVHIWDWNGCSRSSSSVHALQQLWNWDNLSCVPDSFHFSQCAT